MVAQVMGPGIRVADQAFEYLKLQKGGLDQFSHDRKRWENAYRIALLTDYVQIKPHLPKTARYVLDIGSGLGGIDILLHRHYDGACLPVLMDGYSDQPVMELHRKTFSNFHVAELFHADNGVGRIIGIDANRRPLQVLPAPMPLVISLGSWCFHYPVDLYLDYVVQNTERGSVIIVDVRKDKPQWRSQLSERFELKAVVHVAPKRDRIVYHVR
jgi:hypothetical protein